ncbi:AAA family ATPase [Ornithinimicrobium kibberense]|uniref:AAA family ATPase n=1 Tax=Ornithinimicrobium kibberense TaxID=282060 RepID=UPI00361C430B
MGKTTVATNIAASLAEKSPQGTVIVDLDVQFGDVAAALDLEPTYTLGDVATTAVPDLIGLKALLTQHPSGLQVVAGVRSPAEADRIDPRLVGELLQVLRREFRYVVVDSAPGMSEETLTALDHTTDLVLVTTLDVPGIRGLRKELDLLEELGLPPHTRHIVINMFDRTGGISVTDAEATLKHNADIVLPRSPRVARSTNQGTPLVSLHPRDKVSQDLQSLVSRFAPLASRRGRRGTSRIWSKP